ncbi:hypothetical protein D3C75_380430 [compost metagenome]
MKNLEQKIIAFLNELSSLCHKHKLYIEGQNLNIEDSQNKVLVNNVEYDMEAQAYSISFSEVKKLRG